MVVRAAGDYRYVYAPGAEFVTALEARGRFDMGRKRAKPLGRFRRKGAPFGPENDPVPEMPVLEETSPAAPSAMEETSDACEVAAVPATLADEPEDVRVARAALAYVSEKKHGCIRPVRSARPSAEDAERGDEPPPGPVDTPRSVVEARGGIDEQTKATKVYAGVQG
jgi:hypothetical protein